MKKVYYFIVNLLMIFSFFSVKRNIFELLKISAVDEISSPIVNDYSQSNYTNEFMEKTSYFSRNSLGSCGYQAINILLNYYDSFWDDTLIPENYEQHGTLNSNLEIISSPGSIYNDIYAEDVDSSLNYYNMLSNNNIMKKLIDIGINKAYTKLSATSKKDFSLYSFQIFDILKTYLNDYTNTSNLYYLYQSYWENGSMDEFSKIKRNEIIKYVKTGIPVLVTAQNSKVGHAFIAYDYDENLDVIYAHYGYKGYYQHHNFELDYQTITGICTLQPKKYTTHKHAYNFESSNGSYCSCKLNLHVHDYVYSYNFNTHIANCFCGNSFSENHIVNKLHNCIRCNSYIDPNNNFSTLASLGGV